jgi:hypothetical protein
MPKHLTNSRDRKTAKYRHIHLMLQLECSLAAIEKDTKRKRKMADSAEHRAGQK